MKINVKAEVAERYENVGTIETLPGSGASFRYAESWKNRKPALPLSLSLPLSADLYPERALRPYFEGLLPEEQARRIISRELGIPSTRYLKLLGALGQECIGAVLLEPEEDVSCALDQPRYSPLAPEMLDSLAQSERTFPEELAAESRLSLAGAQSKTGLYYAEDGSWWIPLGTAPSNVIVKPGNSRFPRIVDNELFCLNLAKQCGVPAPSAWKVGAERSMLAVTRYDRIPSPTGRAIDGHAGLCRLHQEDFCQAMGLSGQRKYEDQKQHYLARMADMLRRHSTNPLADVPRLFELQLFNYLIGNCDAHAKNCSVLRSPDWSSLSLAPVYDLVSTAVYPELSRNMGLYTGGNRKLDNIGRDDFLDLAEECRIARRAAERSIDAMRERLADALVSMSIECEVEQQIAQQAQRGIRQLAATH